MRGRSLLGVSTKKSLRGFVAAARRHEPGRHRRNREDRIATARAAALGDADAPEEA